MNKEIIVQKEKSLVNAVYRLSLDEQRLFNYAIAKVNPFASKFGMVYMISINDLKSFYGVEHNDAYRLFNDAINRLFDRQATYYDGVLKKQVKCRLIVDVYTDDKGVLGLRFSDQIEKLIHADKDFLSYKLAQTVNITSVNANRIYEILLYELKQCPVPIYKKNISIIEFKEKLGVSDKYKNFSDLKRFVLEVAINQINKHTDIKISYEVIKTGRTPTHLKFTVKYKTKIKAIGEELEQPKIKKIAEHQEEIKFEGTEQRASKDEAKKHLDEMKKHFNVRGEVVDRTPKKTEPKQEKHQGFFSKIFKK